MKKLFIAATLAILLSGCSYSYSEVEAAKSACAKYKGTIQVGATASGEIVVAYCTIDGVRYNYDRFKDKFFNGVKR